MLPPPVKNATVHWQDDGLPWSPDFQDVYFSRGDPRAESEHVFLRGNRLEERFTHSDGAPFVIAELGFGSGLNFLCAWQLWVDTAPPGACLHFISFEQFPLRSADLERFHALWPALATRSQALRLQYQDYGSGLQRLHLGDTQRPVILDLYLGDASTMLACLEETARRPVNAWFLDGFAPRSNPGMWTERIFSAMQRLSTRNTTLATYSVAAAIRQGLSNAGFSLKKAPGHGRKRHMLCGSFSEPSKRFPSTLKRAEVAVIGAGLAGSACASALARLGCPVSLFEQEATPASGASGNPQGALFLPLHREPSQRAHFLRQAAMYAFRHYQRLNAEAADFDWHPDGALQLNEKNGPGFFQAVTTNPLYPEGLVERVSGERAAEISGLPRSEEGLYLHCAGWLNPAALCQRYLRTPGIRLYTHCPVLALHPSEAGWELAGEDGSLGHFSQVIIANSVAAPALLRALNYPLFPNRGQLSYIAATPASAQQALPLCGKGYVLPAQGGRHCIGSSFHPRCSDSSLREEDHVHNLGLLDALAPALSEALQPVSLLGGRASLRCTTSDYLPLAGPVEDPQASLQRCAAQSPAERSREAFVQLQQGLFLCAGLGSHGITTSPLLADHLASALCGLNAPLCREDANLLQPERFLRRRLRQQNYEQKAQ